MKRILVIDDDPALRQNLLDLLEAEGYEGIEARSGEEGVRLAEANPPDLVLCDVAMPGIDGHAVLRQLSSSPETRAIPLIFLSARVDPEDLRIARALGAADTLAKPFSRVALLASIARHLQGAEHLAAAAAATASPPEDPAAGTKKSP